MEKMTKIHKDKNGKVIPDISKVKLPRELEESVFKILNPSMDFKSKPGKNDQ